MTPYYERDGITIFCGDCLEVMSHLASPVDSVITDPPYGIDYQSAWRTDKAQWKPKIANDTKPFIWFLPSAFYATNDISSLFCFCRWDVSEIFRLAIDCAGYDVKSQIIWDRESHGMGDLNGQAAPQHDIIWFATKGKFTWYGSRLKSVIRSLRLNAEELLHPNQKPVSLMEQIIIAACAPDMVVCDPFMGSGTTLVAAQNKGRRAIGIEISEDYCRIAVDRLRQPSFFSLPNREPVAQPEQVSLF